MTSLVDIAKRRVTVSIQGDDIPVNGISAEGLVHLVERFPKLQALIFPTERPATAAVAGAPVGGQRKQRSIAVQAPEELSDAPSMLKSIPEALPAILAAGTGHLADVEHEEAARTLGAEDQIALLEKIMELTMPSGIPAFLTRLTALLLGDVGRQPQPSESVRSISPSAPNGREPATI
jgi:hypothetical protein